MPTIHYEDLRVSSPDTNVKLKALPNSIHSYITPKRPDFLSRQPERKRH